MNERFPPTMSNVESLDLFYMFDRSGGQKRMCPLDVVAGYVKSYIDEDNQVILPWVVGTYATDPSQRYYYKNVVNSELSYTYTAPNASVNNPILLTDSPEGNNEWLRWEATPYDVSNAEAELIGKDVSIYPTRVDLVASVSINNTVPEGTTHLRLKSGNYSQLFLILPVSSGAISSITLDGDTPTQAVIGGNTVNLSPVELNDLTAIARANNVPVDKVGYLAVGEDVTGKGYLYLPSYEKIVFTKETLSGAASDISYSAPIASFTVNSQVHYAVCSEDIPERYVKSGSLPFIWGDDTAGDHNLGILQLCVSLGITDLWIDLIDDLYVTFLTYNDHSLVFDNVKITGSPDKTLYTTGGTLFTINDGGSFIQDGINVSYSGTAVSEVQTTVGTNESRLTKLIVRNNIIDGFIRYGIGLADSSTQDPAVKANGADLIDFSNNKLINCDYASLFLINAMYDKLVVDNNSFTDCKGAIIDNSMQNSTTNYEDVKAFKKAASFTKNTLINDIDFFADSEVAGSVYAAIALSEGNYAWYDGNYCKNLQVKESQTGSCNDFYYADEKSEIGKNTVVNRFHWGLQAQLNAFTNCCLKIKKATNWSCAGYDHFYESDYFDYQIANNDVSLTGIQGDFLAIEHSVSDGPANIINVDGARLYSRVLKSAPRNQYRSQNFTVVNSEFYSNAAGYTEICRAIADDTLDSEFQKSYNVSNNNFNLPNATLSLMSLLLTGSQAVYIKFSDNSGEVLNLSGASVGQSVPSVALRKLEADRNNFLVIGTNAGLISKNAIFPVIENISLNNNEITAVNATSIDSLFGGVVSTAINCSASCKFKVGLSGSIPLDTITGKDAAQPMLAQDGARIVSGVLYDTDFVSFAEAYNFEIKYNLNSSDQEYTTIKFNDTDGVFTTRRSDEVSTTAVEVTTDHPNMTAEITCGVVGSNVIQLTLSLGSGITQRTIEIKHVKVGA